MKLFTAASANCLHSAECELVRMTCEQISHSFLSRANGGQTHGRQETEKSSS